MADKQLPALTAASTLADADLFYAMQSGNSRKATGAQLRALVGGRGLIYKASNETAQNFSAGATMTFGTTEYDTAGMVSGTTKFVVPSALNGRYAKFGWNVSVDLLNANTVCYTSLSRSPAFSGGGSVPARGQINIIGPNFGPYWTPFYLLTTGDEWTVSFTCPGDTSITVSGGGTWFAYEVSPA